MCYSLRNKRKRRKNAISRKVKVRRTIPGSAPTDDGIYSGPTPVLHPSYVKICSVVLCNPAHKPTAKLKDTSENTKPPWWSLYNITSVCCTRKKNGTWRVKTYRKGPSVYNSVTNDVLSLVHVAGKRSSPTKSLQPFQSELFPNRSVQLIWWKFLYFSVLYHSTYHRKQNISLSVFFFPVSCSLVHMQVEHEDMLFLD